MQAPYGTTPTLAHAASETATGRTFKLDTAHGYRGELQWTSLCCHTIITVSALLSLALHPDQPATFAIALASILASSFQFQLSGSNQHLTRPDTPRVTHTDVQPPASAPPATDDDVEPQGDRTETDVPLHLLWKFFDAIWTSGTGLVTAIRYAGLLLYDHPLRPPDHRAPTAAPPWPDPHLITGRPSFRAQLCYHLVFLGGLALLLHLTPLLTPPMLSTDCAFDQASINPYLLRCD